MMRTLLESLQIFASVVSRCIKQQHLIQANMMGERLYKESCLVLKRKPPVKENNQR